MIAPQIRTRNNLDAGPVGFANARQPLIPVIQVDVIVLFLGQQLIGAGVVIADINGRHIEGPVLDHQRNGPIIEVGTVFNGAHPGGHGLVDAGIGVGVGSHRNAVAVCFRDRFRQLIGAEGDIFRVIPH